MSELEEARVLRNSRREGAREIIGTLSWLLTRYRQLEKEIRKGRQLVTVTEKPLIRALRSALHKAEESLEEYEESIVGVMALEGLEDWDEENEHAIESREISDKLDTLGNDVAGLAAHFKEDEDNEEMFNEVYNELAEKAAEAQATFEIARKYEANGNRFEDVSAKAAAEAQAMFEIAEKYEADSNRFEDVSARAGGNMGPDNRYKAGDIRPRSRYKAGGIRPSNRFRAGNMRSGNRYMTSGMRSGNGYRYKAGSMRSDNGYRYRAGNMGIGNRYRYRVGNMRSGSRNKASGRSRTGNRRSGSRNKAASSGARDASGGSSWTAL